MKYLHFTLVSIAYSCLLAVSVDISAQTSSFDQVYQIFQTNCDGSSCHQPRSSNQLKLTDSTKAYVYDHLINIPPVNPWARDNSGNKIIDPFNPANSFLLRKVACNRGSEPSLKDPDEGVCMPENLPVINEADVELIRTWIAGGAPDTGIVSGIFDLSRNTPVVSVFPNPFKDVFSATFSLDQSYTVKMELYDLLGKKVTTFKDEQLTAGDYRYNLKSPESVGAGIYFFRMTVGSSTFSKRIIKLH